MIPPTRHRPPGGRAGGTDGALGGRSVEGNGTADVVRRVPIATLAEAVAGDRHPFAYLDDAAGVRFRCPLCRFVDSNGGTAEVLDGWRWSCRRCGRDRVWTRRLLERLVAEDAAALDAVDRIEAARCAS